MTPAVPAAGHRRSPNPPWRYAPFLAWPLGVAIALAFRVPLAIDETRYLTVAWEMFSRGDWLVPHLNGEFYTHKPPLLFWLIGAGWSVFGVSEWWPRLVPFLLGLGGWALLWRLARRLWPEVEDISPLAVSVAGGMLVWALFQTLIMFDLLLATCVLLGMLGLARAGAGESRGWWLFGLGLGLGILAKGPVALLHLLLPAALGPWWSPAARARRGAWYAGVAGGFAVGAVVALAWVVPAALAGGEEYSRMILWKQTAERVTSSFAHQRPWWWYLPLLPLLVLPWTLWRPALRGALESARRLDGGARFCLAWAVPVFLAFCAISGKQPQYLLPMLPAVALLAARGIADRYEMSYRAGRAAALLPLWLVAAAMTAGLLVPGDWHRGWLEDVHPAWTVALWVVLVWAAAPFRVSLLEGAARLHVATVLGLSLVAAALLGSATGRPYGVGPAAREIAGLQQQGLVVGYYGDYHGQLGFAGRLREPLPELWDTADIAALAARDPTARVLVESRGNPLAAAPLLPGAVMSYRTGYWSVWKAADLARYPGVLESIRARGPRQPVESTE
jgi:4-amino-4-deoxy-L-arabinose transferase-like glycosyltransferase